MEKLKFKINGTAYEAEVNETGDNTAEVEINGKKYSVEIEHEHKAVINRPVAVPKSNNSQAAAPGANTPKPASSAGSRTVKSPLPGCILSVAVAEGQAVKRGQVLLTLESMKMANEVLADKDYTVKKVLVQAGQNVMQGDVLVEVE